MKTIHEKNPKVYVSACLLGQEVRFDGGHKRDRFITESLNEVLDFQAICPEVEAGMSIPRPTIHLREIDKQIHLTESNNGDINYTKTMLNVAEKRAAKACNRISGLIVQKKSPSCGLERVTVSNSKGNTLHHKGRGLFTERFIQRNPLVPVEENGRLNDPLLRENFLERVYCLNRWYRIDENNVTEFINFHAHHKLILMARGKQGYAKLGRIVAGVTKHNLQERREIYIQQFMQTLNDKVARKHHYNVMQHIMGYFKRTLNNEDKKELLDVMQSYVQLQVPLATPVMLFKHHLRKHPVPYLATQYYLQPYPESLALRALV